MTPYTILKYFFLVFSFLFLLTACGGGDDNPAAPTNAAPTATNVVITGATNDSATVGTALSGSYKYNDTEGDEEDVPKSTFRWLREGSAIDGATTKEYILVDADVGKAIKFEVTPVAKAGTKTGISYGTDKSVSVTVATGGSNPAPVNPAPVNPAPVNPTPVNPTPVNPTPVNPTPVNPTPVNPTPVNPAPTNTAPTVNPYITLTTTGAITAKITKANAGDTLIANDGYKDIDGDLIDPSKTIYIWMDGTTVLTNENNPAQHTMAATDTSITVKVTAQSLPANNANITTATKTSAPPVVLAAIVANNVAPVATTDATTGATGPLNSVLGTKTAIPGNKLKGIYTVTDADTNPVDTLGPHTFQWYYLENKDDFESIDDAKMEIYEVLPTDTGKTIVFEVTPLATGTSPGESVKALGVLVNVAPIATTVEITFPTVAIVAGSTTIDGTYVYDDLDIPKDKEDKPSIGTSIVTSTETSFRWLRDTDTTDAIPATEIVSETKSSYTLVAADIGTNIKVYFEVTPKALTGTKTGKPYTSAGTTFAATVPTVTNVSITSIDPTAAVGEVLEGTYLYGTGKEGASKLEWFVGTNIKPAATSLYDPANPAITTYKVLPADQGKDIIFKVTPVDASGTEGTTVPSDPLRVNSAPGIDTSTTPFEFTIADAAGKPVTGTTATVGDIITITYTYTDLDNDLEDKAKSILEIKTGVTPTPLSGTVLMSYSYDPTTPDAPVTLSHIVRAQDVTDGLSFTAEVTPIALTGTTDGAMVPTKIVIDAVAAPPTVIIDSIVSSNANNTTAVQNDTLTVAYTPGTGQNPSTIIWVNVSIDTTGATVRGADLPTTASQDTYVVVAGDIGIADTFIAAEVTPVALDGTPGTPVLSAPITIIGVP